MYFTLKYMPQLTSNREIKRVLDIHTTVHVQGILDSKLLDSGAWMNAVIANPSGLQSFVLNIHAPYSKNWLSKREFIHKDK